MIRLIVQIDNGGMAAHVGGAVLTTFQTFDIEHPEIEAILRATGTNESAHCHAQIIGAEVLHQGEAERG